MNRQDFIFRLFDNGNGLTLDQIEWAERYIEADACGMMEGVEDLPAMREMAREVFFDRLRDCEDLLELRDFLNETLRCNNQDLSVSDNQVYRLWYAVGRAE